MFKLLRFLKPYWWQVIILLLSIALQTWFTLRLPALMATIVNEGIATGNTEIIWTIGFRMLGCAVLTAVGALSSGYFSSKIGTAFASDLREEIYAKILSLELSEVEKFSTASLITRTTNDISQVQQTVVMMLSMLLRAPMMCVVAIIQAFATAPDMTWIIALAIAAVIFFVIVIISSTMKKFKLFQKLLDKITLLTRENLTGFRVIRAFNNESVEKKKFARANSELTDTIIYISKVMSLIRPLIGLVFNLTSLVCIWVGVSLISKDFAYLGNMIAFMQYAIQVIMSFIVLTFFFMMLPRANVSAGRINEVLGTSAKIKWPAKTLGQPSLVPTLEFHNVDFSYRHAEQKVLSNISFSAQAGDTIAIVGSTGSGKSTLAQLIPRFYEATSGEIFVNGIDIRNYQKDDLMQRIGYVPQRGLLFSGTIKSNIAFGAKNISDEDIVRSAKIAQADDFVMKLKEKYNSRVSRGGTNLSGGQKQRLCIARAIAKNPEIYIFDDSFSALDMKTDQKLRAALAPATKNSITLIVAQRVSTIKDADNILVLDRGKIVGSGRHSDLLKTCKVYQEIVRSQLSPAEYEEELRHA
ncbi:ABC transporter ATP-binding protein [Candidatus Saccharibacteria bacterium]|nr:ABC transporter ATP-binding protein [Candidatus Saccharibacteria bacterium]